jgi:hypothetical protein
MAKLRYPPPLPAGIPYASILVTLAVIAALATLLTLSGAIETLNHSGLLR